MCQHPLLIHGPPPVLFCVILNRDEMTETRTLINSGADMSISVRRSFLIPGDLIVCFLETTCQKFRHFLVVISPVRVRYRPSTDHS